MARNWKGRMARGARRGYSGARGIMSKPWFGYVAGAAVAVVAAEVMPDLFNSARKALRPLTNALGGKGGETPNVGIGG